MTQRTDHTLRELQVNLPWSIRYSGDFRANPQPHKDFAHALTHIGKAAGQLHAFVDDMDHRREEAEAPDTREKYTKYLADLVICALRLANTFPGGPVDLQAAVKDRLECKNGVKLAPPGVGALEAMTVFTPGEIAERYGALLAGLPSLGEALCAYGAAATLAPERTPAEDPDVDRVGPLLREARRARANSKLSRASHDLIARLASALDEESARRRRLTWAAERAS